MPTVTIEQALGIAIQHHQAGRLNDAESVYRDILSAQPQQPDALHLLGVLMHQQGKHAEGEQMIRRAIALSPVAEYYSNLAAILEAQRRLSEALDAHQKALSLNPHSAVAHNNHGALLEKHGRVEQAQREFDAALRIQPDYPEARFNLGNLLRGQARYDEALAEYEMSLRLRPDYAEAQLNLGLTLWKQGRTDDALAAFNRAAAMRSIFPEAHVHMALLYEELGRPADAILACRRALSQRPNAPDAWSTLGNAFKAQGKLDEAIAAYRESLRVRPDSAEVLCSLGAALQERGDQAESVAVQLQALALKPDLPEAHVNLASAYRQEGRFDDAIALCRRAMELRPGYAEAKWNLAMGRLLRGELNEGWDLYEVRFEIRELVPKRSFSQPLWDGSPLHGRTILLHAEQGFGDTIQFVRYVPLVRERGGKVLLQCQSALKGLLTEQCGIDQVFSDSDSLPAFDVHCPLMSLPRIFGTTVETIPDHVPYLSEEPALTKAWRDRIATPEPRLKVGLVWAGRAEHKNDRNRSMRLADFASLIEAGTARGARFFSLQKGAPAAQLRDTPIGGHVIDHTDLLSDFAETAAFISNLDLVISVDTAAAHLAGALAKPVWLLLAFLPDWRWLLDRTDSPWYPTMRLFRQSKPRDWQQPLARVAEELNQLISQAKTNAGSPAVLK